MGIILLIISLGLLMWMTMRGINIIIAAIISSSFVAITAGLNVAKVLTEAYMKGFTGFFASWFILFLLGAVFGKVMSDTRAADSIANALMKFLGEKWAVLATVLTCAIMTYGGVSLFVVGFSVYPLAVSLFRSANLPRRFIPAAMILGSVSFTMTMPGSPEIQNLIPTKFFHTTPWAGGVIGILIALGIAVAGCMYLMSTVKKAVARGERYDEYPVQDQAVNMQGGVHELAAAQAESLHVAETSLPHFGLAVMPLIVVVVSLAVMTNGFHVDSTIAAVYSMVAGIVIAWLLMFRFIREFWGSLADGASESIVAISNTSAVVGFGSVVALTQGFKDVIHVVTHMPGSPYLGLGIAVTIIAGITGSASGGLGIALPILAPIYTKMGLDPGAMHRISALASGGLDAMPHNGYVVTLIRSIAKDTHKRAYWPLAMVSVVITTIGLLLAIILFSIFH
ncbi:GntP family permease [Aneurinibacillus sp. Ricciae_BoGa-3]|uniref:GntP family permease n=1 Tax=Aneurinibacillus sp. Ricciae_BoGa-3 TaxID=3022697 RepID=UPI0023426773|nr:SLC13 family permease [Aneurinibacillus sp. Ricciae_BoGa-3]WCK56694.1 GntP family permease [Aneurinibacillus sp. Ricciae_BoGa-3]